MSARRWFLVAYTVSGAAALIYEVAWTRLLTLMLGHSTAAVSTVLTAFMGGLAGGAAAGGMVASRLAPSHALMAYAGLEGVIAAFGLVLPRLLDSSRPLLTWAYADGSGGVTFAVIRVLVCLMFLLLPTACMGATFPLAVRWLVDERSGKVRNTQAGGDEAGAGSLYTTNTLGAAIGVALAGFVLLPGLGLTRTLLAAAALNGMAGTTALLLLGRARTSQAAAETAPHQEPVKKSRRADPTGPPGGPNKARPTYAFAISSQTPQGESRGRRKPKVTRGDEPAPPSRSAIRIVIAGIFLSGLSALIFEVAWTRVLAMVLGPTTYAFSAMLMAFIGGIGVGSLLGTRLTPRTRRPVFWLGVTILAASAGGAVATFLLARAPLVIATAVTNSKAHFGSVLGIEVGLAVVLMLPATLAFGAAFPLALGVASQWLHLHSRAAAAVYVANTLGAISGSLLAAFAFIPLVGLRHSLTLATLVAAVTGAAIVAASEARGLIPRLVAGATVLLFTGLAVLPDWNPKLLAAGAYKYAPYVRHPDLESALEAGTLLYYREGAAATVAVRKLGGHVSLSIDGKVDASNGADMLTQKLLAHLPLLLHPQPKRVAIVGLGSGVTLGSALRHPIQHADTFEISREVVEGSTYFARENHRALTDPRSRLIVGDGRTHLSLARDTYDVIISEPSNPWMAGVASLFTREFFEDARRRLTAGGVICQWAHTYDISEEDLRSIMATFVAVFPDSTLWLVGSGDLLLIGSVDRPVMPQSLGLEELRQRLVPAVEEDLSEVEARRPFTFLSLFVGGGDDLTRYAAGARIQTDDDPGIEFSGPRSIFGRSAQDNAAQLRTRFSTSAAPRLIREARETAGPADYRDRGLMLLRADATDRAFEDLVEVVKRTPDDPAALNGLVRTVTEKRAVAAVTLLEGKLAQHPKLVPLRVALAHLLAAQGRWADAISILEYGIALADDPVPLQEQLASVHADQGNARELESIASQLVGRESATADAFYYLATSRYLQGHHEQTLELAREATKKNPRHSRALNLIGVTNVALGRQDEARNAFVASIQADPRDPASYTNLGLLELEALNLEAAAGWFAEALTIDPRSPSALEGLAHSLERQGYHARAQRLRTGQRRQATEQR